jgi:hypothetical protein
LLDSDLQNRIAIANGAKGPTNIDDLLRELLDEMLAAPPYRDLLPELSSDSARKEMVNMWHKLERRSPFPVNLRLHILTEASQPGRIPSQGWLL